MGASKFMMTMKKKNLHSPLLIRAELDALLSPHSIAVITASPSPAYYPPIFLSPAPSPSPLPASTSHSSLPTAAIVGGSVAGAVVALAVTATIISTVAGKVGLSCILAPVLRLLTSLGGGITGLSTKLNSLCSNFQWWNHRKDGSGNVPGKADPNIDLCIDVLAAGRSPEAVAKAETAAATAYSLAKSPLQDVVKAHGDQPGTSAQSFLTTQASEFAEGELKKQMEFIMQPLNQNVMKAQGYFESLYSTTSNASDELKALRSSTHTYLDEVGKLKSSAEHMGKPLMFEEAAIEVGAEKIKKSIIASEYAAEMKRLQKLQIEPLIFAEEVVLNRVLAKTSNLSGGEAYHHQEASNQHIHRNDASVDRVGPIPIVQTLSDANELQEEMGAMAANHSGAYQQQYMSSVALVPTTASAGAEGAIRPTAGPIVPVPTKRTMTSAAAKKPRWQLTPQGKKGKRPTNLGHVSFSCEISAHRLHFFTSCKSGGSYGSPPPSHHAGDDLQYYNNNNHVEMHELDLDSNINNGEASSYYNNSFASHHPNSYGGNNHVGLLTSSSGPNKHHYNANVQNHQPITNSSSSYQMPPPNTSTKYGSNSHAPLEMQELDLDSNINNGEASSYYHNTFASHHPNSYGGNKHVGLLTRSSAPIKLRYNANVQNHQPITNSSSSYQIPPPNTSTKYGSNSHAPLDYGNPFDGVL